MEKQIIGYVHNVSPVKAGPKKKYFDFDLQTDSEVSVRGVCFPPPKRKLLVESQEKSVPVKIRKFMNDKKEGSTDILMGDFVNVEMLAPEDIDFEKKDILPPDLNLSMLPLITVQQLLSLKAKVVCLNAVEMVTTPQCSLKKVDGVLVDEYGSVKITLWEDDIEKVEKGKTYQFKNLRLKKNKLTGEIYVNPAKGNSSITECEAFETILDIPEDIPTELTTATIDGEIVGVTEVKLDHCCIKCNKPLVAKKEAKCENPRCKLTEKLEKCKKQWYVKALIEIGDITVYLSFRHNCIIEIYNSIDDIEKLSEESVTEAFLSLPKLSVTYNRKSSIVDSVTVSTWYE